MQGNSHDPPPREGGAPDARRLATGPVAHARLRTFFVTLALVAALALGKTVLVPFALASLLAFLLAPVASRLERMHLNRGVAAAISVFLVVLAIAGVIWFTASQAMEVLSSLPTYRKNIEAKFEGLRGAPIAKGILESSKGLDQIVPSAPTPEIVPGTERPTAVKVVEGPPSFFEKMGAIFGPLLGPFATLAVVLLLALFLLAYRMDMRDRLIRLLSRGQIGITAQALEEAGRRVSRYLAANLLVNVIYGIAVGVGLHAIGVPSAAVWALLAAVLRFVPYVGVWIGAAFPVVVSLAVFDSWGPTGLVVILYLGIDLLVGNLVEPLVYGKRTGLSPLSVVLATVIWTWLWGAPGLLLALPMTLCLSVAGRYVPGLEFLDVLLGDAPALGPGERLYERLVSLDTQGACRVAIEQAESGGLDAALDGLLLGALRRAAVDRQTGALDEERVHGVSEGVIEVADELVTPVPLPREGGDAPASGDAARPRVLVVSAGSDADRAAGELLVRMLLARGVAAEAAAQGAAAADVADRAEREGFQAVAVGALPPFAAPRVRYFVRRLRCLLYTSPSPRDS